MPKKLSSEKLDALMMFSSNIKESMYSFRYYIQRIGLYETEVDRALTAACDAMVDATNALARRVDFALEDEAEGN